jgi:hypothetical protein
VTRRDAGSNIVTRNAGDSSLANLGVDEADSTGSVSERDTCHYCGVSVPEKVLPVSDGHA